jgi:hypothetical protein
MALNQSHSHDWVLIQGGGNGILCALGKGGPLDRNARSPTVVAFLHYTFQYRGRQEAQYWLDMALTDRDSKAVGDWLQWNLFPETGFDSATEYDEWRQRADEDRPEVGL